VLRILRKANAGNRLDVQTGLAQAIHRLFPAIAPDYRQGRFKTTALTQADRLLQFVELLSYQRVKFLDVMIGDN